MSNLARQEMYFGRFFSIDERIVAEESNPSSPSDIQALARLQLFRPESHRSSPSSATSATSPSTMLPCSLG